MNTRTSGREHSRATAAPAICEPAICQEPAICFFVIRWMKYVSPQARTKIAPGDHSRSMF